ncbi:MAG: hypothetical protein RL181_886 [Bacteroidota bacterium]|jgi:hypothetical protein
MDEKLLQSVYNMLLLGTQRTAFTEEQLQALQRLGLNTALPPEELLLQCLAYFHVWEKAARQTGTAVDEP